MSLTKDWMTEDNLADTRRAGDRRTLHRALSACIATAVLYEQKRGVVGAAFEKAKRRLTPDEITSLQSITHFPYAYGHS